MARARLRIQTETQKLPGARLGTMSKYPNWHGSYLTEAEIVDDIVAKVKGEPPVQMYGKPVTGVQLWLDPASWLHPMTECADVNPPPWLGCLYYAGMGIRNIYGLWHPENPYVPGQCPPNDPMHPDAISARVIEVVKQRLRMETVNPVLQV